mmetsp:Transcript_15273/g.25189  ORF Transcript_15273/g.25189 Transcript_15273/m.25189 type:complete len:552 (-) Transcript_15273:474-2129(-)
MSGNDSQRAQYDNRQRSREDSAPQDGDPLKEFERAGRSVTSILWPVCITMALVIFVVATLERKSIVTDNYWKAYMVYNEGSGDSAAAKLGGALLNALIFIAVILGTTIIFFLLFKFRCMKLLFAWIMFSTTVLLALLGGYLFYLMLLAYDCPIDWVTFSILMWNFSIVGMVAIFWKSPTVVTQGYLILVSVVLAWTFTKMPDWTMWMLLAALVIYDIAVVLTPKGPLKMLVELAQQRNEPIPGLIYDARPSTLHYEGPRTDHWNTYSRNQPPNGTDPATQPQHVMAIPQQREMQPSSPASVPRPPIQASGRETPPPPLGPMRTRSSTNDDLLVSDVHSQGSVPSNSPSPVNVREDTAGSRNTPRSRLPPGLNSANRSGTRGGGYPVSEQQQPLRDVVVGVPVPTATATLVGTDYDPSTAYRIRPPSLEGGHLASMSQGAAIVVLNDGTVQQQPQPSGTRAPAPARNDDDDDEDEEAKGIKLGLGDFVFYSVLIARAAQFDFITVATCFFSILTVSLPFTYIHILSCALYKGLAVLCKHWVPCSHLFVITAV